MKKIKRVTSLFLLTASITSQAVNINPKGLGEVLIYPYYTVNNNYNTFYTVVNTTFDAKAIKVKFLEGQNSREVLGFNVYLAPYDVWVGNLSPTDSTVAGHQGEPSVAHTTADNSCTPFLLPGQEFLPFQIETDLANNNLQRAREGHIEVYEMGTITGSSQAAIDLGTTGTPADCQQIEDAWDGVGYWDLDSTVDMLPATGGISGTGTLINIIQGTAVGYDAIALNDFWQGTEVHTPPGSLLPNLNSAFSQSQTLSDGMINMGSWSTGAEAVSAIFMQHKLFNEYDYSGFINGKSEWVITFPTKNYHTNSIEPLAPFTQLWNGFDACEDHLFDIWDREEIEDSTVAVQSCYSVNVLEFLRPGSAVGPASQLLGSNHYTSVIGITAPVATEAGWASLTLDANGQSMTGSSNVQYAGLPATGFLVREYTNAGAAEGILAIYSGLFPHKTEPKITAVVDLIFRDSFEAP